MNKSKTIIPMMFISTLIISPTALAEMPDSLFGYKIGDYCEKDTIINGTDADVVLRCASTINKIASITVKFRSVSYEELLKRTTEIIGSGPTTQTENKKQTGCIILNPLKQDLLGKQKTNDPKKSHFTGKARWISSQRVTGRDEPKVEVSLKALNSFGCKGNDYEYDEFKSTIYLGNNEVWETDHQTSLQNENARKNETLNKLFN